MVSSDTLTFASAFLAMALSTKSTVISAIILSFVKNMSVSGLLEFHAPLRVGRLLLVVEYFFAVPLSLVAPRESAANASYFQHLSLRQHFPSITNTGHFVWHLLAFLVFDGFSSRSEFRSRLRPIRGALLPESCSGDIGRPGLLFHLFLNLLKFDFEFCICFLDHLLVDFCLILI